MILWPIQSDFTNKLPYFFQGVGVQYNQEHVIRPNGRKETEWSHSYYQMIQCVKGSGKVILAHKTTALTEGQLLFLIPDEPHEYYAVTDEWIVNWVIFSGTAVESYAKDILELTHSDVYSLSAPQIIADRIELLYHTFLSGNPSNDLYGSVLVYELLADLYHFMYQKQTDSRTKKANKLAPVFDYISQNFHRPIALSDLAPLVGLTEQYLCTGFKALTSLTVFEYIMMYRIQKSKELLLNHRGMPIKEVALSCGFRDVSYFGAIFKKYEHLTPGQFRELH